MTRDKITQISETFTLAYFDSNLRRENIMMAYQLGLFGDDAKQKVYNLLLHNIAMEPVIDAEIDKIMDLFQVVDQEWQRKDFHFTWFKLGLHSNQVNRFSESH